MKKTGLIIMMSLSLLIASACGQSQRESALPSAAETTEPAVAVGTPEAAPTPTDAPTPQEPESPKDEETIDVDLTQLSSTMVYSEVYNMLYNQDDYKGKKVKMRGLYYPYDSGGKRHYACLVQDATACCAQGLDFEMSQSGINPDDYANPGDEITVVGTFDAYRDEDNGSLYVYLVLRNARFA